jgi:hypothetical protein
MTSRRTDRLATTGALVVLLALVGCGGGSSGSSPTPVTPNMVGEYAGTWTQQLTADGQAAGTLECPCTLTIPSQTENNFYGRSTLSAPCSQGLIFGQGRGGTLAISDGRIETSGSVSFRFSEDFRVGLSAGGCTVTAMPPFSGSYAGSTISVQRTEVIDCSEGDAPVYQLAVRLVAARN